MRAWIRFLGWNSSPSPDAVQASLARTGIDLVPLHDPRLADGPGILMLGGRHDQVEDEVGMASRAGSERVIVVASSAVLLAGDFSWRLIAAGASDVLTWNPSGDAEQQIAARLERWHAIEALVRSAPVRERLVGSSPSWAAVLRQIVEAAHFTDASILITGESGTGKELVASLIHELDARPQKRDFVVVDCTTVVPTLSGSEFFGHEKGAFTGAITPREGAFALADGGTLFLDEVGELSLTLQAELLRVIQEGTYKRVGSNVWRTTRFRLVCATNRDLLQEESAGRFRRDLYYRIAGWVLHLPSLRERRGDIHPLTRFFLAASRNGDVDIDIDRSVWDLLLVRDYPGNVRDLRQLVWRMSRRHVGPGPITVGDVPTDDRPRPCVDGQGWHANGFDEAVRLALAGGLKLKEIAQQATEAAIRIACIDEQWNLQRAARRLGITDRALQLRRAANRLPASDTALLNP